MGERKVKSRRTGTLRRIPGARAALTAFVLTVLLGAGGAAAQALWQQSATATMTVTAAGSWAGPAVTSLTCSNNPSHKTATLTLQLPRTASVTYAAVQADGSTPKTYPWGMVPTGAPGSTLTLDDAAPIFKDNPAGQVTVKITAAYADQTEATAQLILTFSSNGKIGCP